MRLPVDEYRRSAIRSPRPLPTGLDRLTDRLVGRVRRCSGLRRKLLRDARRVASMRDECRALSDDALRQRLRDARDLFRRQAGEVDAAAETSALALVREAAFRQLGMEPFEVQLAGALALHRGCLAEMATGEGKTLAAAVAAVLAGWIGKPCHVITVNDYLARRDAENMAVLYRFCDVTVGHVVGGMEPDARRKAYRCDVVYGTSKEIVADFLRDRIQMGALQHAARRHVRFTACPQLLDRHALVMRGLHTAIVDEADSVLVDEAVTPLIIAHPHEVPYLRDATLAARNLVCELRENIHFRADPRYREIEILPAGQRYVNDNLLAFPQVFSGGDRALFFVRQALQAEYFFSDRQQYVNDEGRIVIIDEFTGRAMPQRSWSQGLHQAVEAKEGLDLSAPSETLARLSFQRFYRFYHKIGGMSGTAVEAADELWEIYRLAVVRIPPNRPCRRMQLPDRIVADAAAKWEAVAEEVARVQAEGRPVLIGTRNVAASEALAQRLSEAGISFRLLNAVNHRQEADIIAEAGNPGCVTIATNMAGRGTDIVLGKGVAERGGLHVIATERHESGRIDRQLFGRSGRQGDPGSAVAFLCKDDELLQRFIGRTTATLFGPRFARWASQRAAQRLAERQRRNVLEQDTWIADSLSFAAGADAELS